MEPTISSGLSSLRFSLLMFGTAAMLTLAAAWLLAPVFAGAAATTGLAIFSALGDPCRAARIAVVRGDLWAACGEDVAGAPNERMRQAALGESASWAPSISKTWLSIAAGESDPADRHAEALRMSFYTGPNELDVIPLRLSLALRPGMLPDTDMERLVRHDVLVVLTHAPHLRPALIAAYREAPPEGRRFLAAAVEEIDPGFAPDLRSGGLPGNKK